jgi:mRNA-degrading endonuclease RelE of RelBE toxin-antitoxin system
MFTLRFADPSAGRSFDRLPRRAQLQSNRAFELIVEQPRSRSPSLDVHQLSGYRNVWTLRVPPWRGIYAIDGDEVVFLVFGHRDNVYVLLHNLLPPEARYVVRSGRRGSSRSRGR